MIIFLFRILLLLAIAFILYSLYKYFTDSRRKLDQARDQEEFYFHDNMENIKENFLITYRGLVFEGEKYLGTTEHAFDVMSVYVSTKTPEKLRGLNREDLYYLEREILQRYPYASIEWKYPISRLILTSIKDED